VLLAGFLIEVSDSTGPCYAGDALQTLLITSSDREDTNTKTNRVAMLQNAPR